MRFRAADLVRCVVAGIVAAAIVGFLLTLLMGLLIAGPAGLLFTVFISPGIALICIKFYSLPAILIGGPLWLAGADLVRARRMWLWAAVGAAAGFAAFLLPGPGQPSGGPFPEESQIAPWLVLLYAIAGAAAALAFRGTMRVTRVFVADED